ncbi:MAG: LptF/LptG family permease [Planctomycetaceae bacterium]|nr:LptF/LptG family permease [Planctomycetaceae bacterium]
MKILDRYIVRTFLTTTFMWFIVLMSLRIMLDLFINLDEFAKGGGGMGGTLGRALEYYSAWSTVYFQQLGKAIIVFGALTTLYTMNRTNELTAILASGRSLHRVILPIIACALALSVLNIANQEVVIPPLGPILTADRDARAEKKLLQVYLTPDKLNSTWYSNNFDAATGVLTSPLVVLREDTTKDARPNFRGLATITGTTGKSGQLQLLRPVPGAAAETLSGWFIGQGKFTSYRSSGKPMQLANSEAVVTSVTSKPYMDDLVKTMNGQAFTDKAAVYCLSKDDPTLSMVERTDVLAQMTLRAREFASVAGKDGKPRIPVLLKPQFIFRGGADNRILAVITADHAVEKIPGRWDLAGGSVFCPTDLTAKELQMRQNTRWLDYLSTSQLSSMLESGTLPNLTKRAMLTKHLRFAEPFNSLILLLLVVPFMLSRERNLKASTLLGVAMGVGFYAFIYICQYASLSPTLTAWLPVLLFGPVAVVMLDSVKT